MESLNLKSMYAGLRLLDFHHVRSFFPVIVNVFQRENSSSVSLGRIAVDYKWHREVCDVLKPRVLE